MIRSIQRLAEETYDLAIIGGGIYGACLAWEAASRGLSAALLEQGDFASGTSANSMKIIHGGFRYLQSFDFKRMRASMGERKNLMRIAPHLVHPQPVLIPAYGHALKGREILSLGLLVNDLMSFDRNQLEDPEKRIPAGRTISRQECAQLLPGINPQGLTGGAIFHDAMVYNSERLVLAYLRSAHRAGAALANYARVTGLLKKGERVTGVRAVDVLRGESFEVRARLVVNTSGPWLGEILEMAGAGSPPAPPLIKAINLVARPVFEKFAVGLPGRSLPDRNEFQSTSTVLQKGSSFLFVVPWRGYSILGTSYQAHPHAPGRLDVTGAELHDLVGAINRAYPPADLKPEEIRFVHAGLLPGRVESPGAAAGEGAVKVLDQYRIYDHRQQGVQGLLSVMGVKYTTARQIAAQVVDRIFRLFGFTPAPSVTSFTPLYGGSIERFEPFLEDQIRAQPCGLDERQVRQLVYNYGSAYPDALRYFEAPGSDAEKPELEQALLRAEVRHAIREEMALKLGDIVFRRTELGSAGFPGEAALQLCAQVAGEELGWSQDRLRQEMDEVRQVYQFRGKG